MIGLVGKDLNSYNYFPHVQEARGKIEHIK